MTGRPSAASASMRKSRNTRRIDGFLLLDKPPGIGSNAVLQHVKRLYRAERAGHTGTLDPLAGGLLPLCLGEATKFAGELLHADKAYHATLALGERTSTGDAEGEVLERRPVSVDMGTLASVLARFTGEIRQVPPMYSALKRDGVPLYVHARAGRTLEREPRGVRIHALDLLRAEGTSVEIAVHCSKGTYVRVLAEDIGEALGCGAHLARLVRTRIGPFALGQAHAPEAVEALDEAGRDGLLLPVDALLSGCPRVELGAQEAERFGHGAEIRLTCAGVAGTVRVYGAGKGFLGTGRVEDGERLLPRRLLARSAPASVLPLEKSLIQG